MSKKEIKNSPYTYVKTMVMKSLLFEKPEYHRMLKMSFAEIAKLLQESQYRKEINVLGVEHEGADLLELALNLNLGNTFKKLHQISPSVLGEVIERYAARNDFEDMKTILRGKSSGSDQSEIIRMLTCAGILKKQVLLDLTKKETVDQILKDNPLVPYNKFKKALKIYQAKKDLTEIEHVLDQQYYAGLLQLGKQMSDQGKYFLEFIEKEIQLMNLLAILRAKVAHENAENILISTGKPLKDMRIESLSKISSLNDVIKKLSASKHFPIMKEGIQKLEENGTGTQLENALRKQLLNSSMLLLHQHPISVDVILGYMLAKDVEVRNLRIIVKGKQLGISEQNIEEQLVW